MATSKPSISASFQFETMEETLDIKPQGEKLFIGIPKEIAFQENRIALTPDAVGVLVANGNHVQLNIKRVRAVIILIRIMQKQEPKSCTTKQRFIKHRFL